MQFIKGRIQDIERIYAQYEAAFPKEERKTLEQLKKLASESEYMLLLAIDDKINKEVGFAFICYAAKGYVWLDYIAIYPEYRSRGYGSNWMQTLIEAMTGWYKGLFIEVEAPISEQPETRKLQKDRIRFYERFQAQKLELDYAIPTEEGRLSLDLYFISLEIPQSELKNREIELSKEDIGQAIQAVFRCIHSDIAWSVQIMKEVIDTLPVKQNIKVGTLLRKIFKMCIMNVSEGQYEIEITTAHAKHGVLKAILYYMPSSKAIEVERNTVLGLFLQNHLYPLSTMLRNKRSDTFYKGFELFFVLRLDKDTAAFNDRTKVVVLNKSSWNTQCYVQDNPSDSIDRLYTDASISPDGKQGGMAIIHENQKGDQFLYEKTSSCESSSLLELYAVAEGLRILKDVKRICIVTDSQYVRKGLTEWIFNWRLNGWTTVNGEKAKNITVWKEVDALTQNKYIELQWVKGHNGHIENTLCDWYAREMARKNRSESAKQ